MAACRVAICFTYHGRHLDPGYIFGGNMTTTLAICFIYHGRHLDPGYLFGDNMTTTLAIYYTYHGRHLDLGLPNSTRFFRIQRRGVGVFKGRAAGVSPGDKNDRR